MSADAERARVEADLAAIERAWLLERVKILGHPRDERPTGPRRASIVAWALVVIVGAGELGIGLELHELDLVEAGLGTTACAVAVAALEDRRLGRYETARVLYEARRGEILGVTSPPSSPEPRPRPPTARA